MKLPTNSSIRLVSWREEGPTTTQGFTVPGPGRALQARSAIAARGLQGDGPVSILGTRRLTVFEEPPLQGPYILGSRAAASPRYTHGGVGQEPANASKARIRNGGLGDLAEDRSQETGVRKPVGGMWIFQGQADDAGKTGELPGVRGCMP